MDMDRRRFMELGAVAFAAMTLPACASVAVTRMTPSGGAVRLQLRNFPQLAHSGGYLKIQPDGAPAPVYVLVLEDRRYVALSPICTHLGCTVNIEGERLVCPCHGSTYDRTGRVLRGPAEQALRQFPATVDSDGVLVIQLGGAG